jgi:hypothetical protein
MSESTQRMRTLTGHVSPETAFVVDDYPYGFTLRCKIRYWLEWKPNQGFRFVSQTTNPKLPGEVWNKPKASTYCLGPSVMLLDESNGHITWTGVSGYCSLEEVNAFIAKHEHAFDEHQKNAAIGLRLALERYAARKAAQAAAVVS